MVFGQITLELSVFWTAATLAEAMCYRGILEIRFWTAGSGAVHAGVALLGCSLATCFLCQCFLRAVFITSCSMGCLVQECTSSILNAFLHFLPNKLQLLCHCQLSRPLDFSPFQYSNCFLSHVSSRIVFRNSHITEKCVHSSFSNNFF